MMTDLLFQLAAAASSSGANSADVAGGIVAFLFAWIGIIILVWVGLGLLSLALSIYVAYIESSTLARIPEPHRDLEPWVPWLILVPLVWWVIPLLVGLKLPESLRRYFEKEGGAEDIVGDYASNYGQFYGMCTIGIYVLGPILWLPSVILMILYIQQVARYRERLPG